MSRCARQRAVTATMVLSSTVALATALPAAGASRPSPTATLEACHPAPQQDDRYAVFSGQMSALPTSTRMAMRFELLQVVGHRAGFRRVSGPGLDQWERSQRGVTIFGYRKQVANLPFGAYRGVVRFRWYDATGRVIRQARRSTTSCQVADQRPHLAVGEITRQPGPQPRTGIYDVTVINRGLGASGPFGVLLTVDGAAQPLQTITLGSGERHAVSFEGPRCDAGGTLQVTLDPQQTIDQTTRADSVKTVGC